MKRPERWHWGLSDVSQCSSFCHQLSSFGSGSPIGLMPLCGNSSIWPLPYDPGKPCENSKCLVALARVALGCVTLPVDRSRVAPKGPSQGESPIPWGAMGAGPVLVKPQGLPWEQLILQNTSKVEHGCELENTSVETDFLLLWTLCSSRYKIFPEGKGN